MPAPCSTTRRSAFILFYPALLTCFSSALLAAFRAFREQYLATSTSFTFLGALQSLKKRCQAASVGWDGEGEGSNPGLSGLTNQQEARSRAMRRCRHGAKQTAWRGA